MNLLPWVAAFCCGLLGLPVLAQDAKPLWEEYERLISKSQGVAAMGPTLVGDQVDLYSGTLSFEATDVSLRGNSALPVAISRKFAVTNRKGYLTGDQAFGF